MPTPLLNFGRMNVTGAVPTPKPPAKPVLPTPALPTAPKKPFRRIPWGGGSALEQEMKRLFPNWDTLAQNQKAQIFEQWGRGQRYQKEKAGAEETARQTQLAELSAWMEANPQMYYNQYITGLGFDQPRLAYFQGNFGNIYQGYQNKLIEQARQGTLPELKFGDYLSGFDWEQEYMKQPYYLRGGARRTSLLGSGIRNLNW